MRLAWMAGILVLCFIYPLCILAGFAFDSEFYSYILLIPPISGYLIWLRRAGLGTDVRPSWGAAAAAAAGGGAILGAYFYARQQGWFPADADFLAVIMPAFLLLLLAAGFATLGAATMSSIAFPLCILLFMIPYPEALYAGIEMFFRHVSAVAAQGFFLVAGTRCHREGLFLSLPTDFTLEIGHTCSGVHSSQVLLITSLLAGNLFLRSPWRRAFLAFFVIPLAIVRNGFRILVIGELCVHVNHDMIDSWIHHQGGPFFFALSLIPFFLVLIWLRKSESKTQNAVEPRDKNSTERLL
jgi:exosortase C (VPDSG-CTERM-specific)